MQITRRDILPAVALVTTLGGGAAAKAALPLRVVATADGPYVSRVIDLGPAASKTAAKPRHVAEHNRDRYIHEIG